MSGYKPGASQRLEEKGQGGLEGEGEGGPRVGSDTVLLLGVFFFLSYGKYTVTSSFIIFLMIYTMVWM